MDGEGHQYAAVFVSEPGIEEGFNGQAQIAMTAEPVVIPSVLKGRGRAGHDIVPG